MQVMQLRQLHVGTYNIQSCTQAYGITLLVITFLSDRRSVRSGEGDGQAAQAGGEGAEGSGRAAGAAGEREVPGQRRAGGRAGGQGTAGGHRVFGRRLFLSWLVLLCIPAVGMCRLGSCDIYRFAPAHRAYMFGHHTSQVQIAARTAVSRKCLQTVIINSSMLNRGRIRAFAGRSSGAAGHGAAEARADGGAGNSMTGKWRDSCCEVVTCLYDAAYTACIWHGAIQLTHGNCDPGSRQPYAMANTCTH